MGTDTAPRECKWTRVSEPGEDDGLTWWECSTHDKTEMGGEEDEPDFPCEGWVDENSAARTAEPKMTVDEAAERMDVFMGQALEFTAKEVHAALLVLALAARDEFPEAATVVLGDSDQGEWLWVEQVLDDEGTEVEGSDNWDEQDTGASSHLYDYMRDTYLPFAPLAEYSTRNNPKWLLDIHKVLSEIPALIESS